jgi:hypothetical protein
MPCSEEFWRVFWPTLGGVLAVLPAIVVFWGSFGFWMYWSSREDRRAAERREQYYRDEERRRQEQWDADRQRWNRQLGA